MGDFSADWLTLREPADRRARASNGLVQSLVERFGIAGASSLSALDLGTGTGANVRVVASHLRHPQHWRLVDRDGDLLRQLPKHIAAWALDRGAVVGGGASCFTARGETLDCAFEVCEADLRKLADDTIFGPIFEGRALVTASALLDLVSESWLEVLVRRCLTGGAAVLFALTYDGRMTCTPEDADDAWICALVNRHQRLNKGLGPALGPEAAPTAVRLLQAVGYHVEVAASDWVLGPSDTGLQRALLEGWAEAAAELARAERSRANGWLARRLGHLDAGASLVIVGHQDVAGWRA